MWSYVKFSRTRYRKTFGEKKATWKSFVKNSLSLNSKKNNQIYLHIWVRNVFSYMWITLELLLARFFFSACPNEWVISSLISPEPDRFREFPATLRIVLFFGKKIIVENFYFFYLFDHIQQRFGLIFRVTPNAFTGFRGFGWTQTSEKSSYRSHLI